MLRKILSFMPRFWTNWLTLLGAAITSVSGSTIVLALAAALVTPSTKPYAAALTFLIMPAVFVFGLVLIAVGFAWQRFRRGAEASQDPIQKAFAMAARDKRSRRLIVFVSVATLLNIAIVGAAGNAALDFMDSPTFCGKLCHTVMQPEYESYLESPHSRVKCVQCHIGPGASWAVKSKVDGLKQVWGVLTGSYVAPIPSPVHALRPARDTCEQCHWPDKFHGNRVNFAAHYSDDEENSAEVTALMMRVGGKNPRTGEYHGIHWHVRRDTDVRFETLDERREKVGKISVFKDGKLVEEYAPPEGANAEVLETRSMDCVDCHNRPTHVFDQTPRLAVDRAFTEGLLDKSLPYLHAAAVKTLEGGGTELAHDDADAYFASSLGEYYDTEQPQAKPADDQLRKSATALAALHRRNVYPDMKLGWEAHPNHLGHRGEEKDKRGCFRCHNDEHATADGKTLSMDCDLCHELLVEEEAPEDLPESLQSLFFGPTGD